MQLINHKAIIEVIMLKKILTHIVKNCWGWTAVIFIILAFLEPDANKSTHLTLYAFIMAGYHRLNRVEEELDKLVLQFLDHKYDSNQHRR